MSSIPPTEQENTHTLSGTTCFSTHSPLESNSDSDSSSSKQEEMEEEMTENIEKWKEALKANPKDLEAYNKLIEAYRKSGEVDELRSTRLQMKKAFPLSPCRIHFAYFIHSNME